MSKPSAWIKAGYQWFAYNGPDTMKIEVLARSFDLKRSNYYYHFKLNDRFLEEILKEHEVRNGLYQNEIENSCSNYYPDYLRLLVQFKEYVYFQKQLAFRQDKARFKAIFQTTHLSDLEKVVPLWVQSFQIPTWEEKLVLELMSSWATRFFAQLEPDSYTFEFLVQYSKDALNLFKQFADQTPLTDEELNAFFPALE